MQAVAPGTQRNRLVYFKTYLWFCKKFQLQDLPAQNDTPSLYAEYLTRSLKSPKSIHNYLYGAKLLHVVTGFQTAAFDSFMLKQTLQAIQRSIRHFANPAPPISTFNLAKIINTLESDILPDLALKTLILMIFYTFIRASSILPPNQSSFDFTRHMCFSDVIAVNNGLAILIKYAKNRQSALQNYIVFIYHNANSKFCLVRALSKLRSCYINAKPNDPLFQIQGRSLSLSMAYSLLYAAVKKAHILDTKITFNAIRKGGATAAFDSGLSVQDIRLHGGWFSNAAQSYISRVSASRKVAAVLSKFKFL